MFCPLGRARARLSVVLAVVLAASLLAVGTAPPADADVPVRGRITFTDRLGVAVTGAPAATDGPDADTNLDQLALPASAPITSSQVPSGARPFRAFLYWTGSFDQVGPACSGPGDDTVTLTVPDGTTHQVSADVRFCSDGSAASYDMWSYRANVSKIVRSTTGTFTFDDFAPDIRNRASDNASFSMVLLYTHPDLPVSTVVISDGLLEMQHAQWTISAEVPLGDQPVGDLAFYAVAGDPSTTGGESVTVTGLPGAATQTLTDPLNPPHDPMNHTINVLGRNDTLGVDVDRFSIDGALTPRDHTVEVTFKAASDKWWLVYMVLLLGPVEVPVLGVRDASVKEGDSGLTRMTFVVFTDRASARDITFNFRTVDGTAKAPGDYRASSGQLTLPAGRRGMAINIMVRGNTKPQPDRRFYVALVRPQGATLGKRVGVGLIIDDDR